MAGIDCISSLDKVDASSPFMIVFKCELSQTVSQILTVSDNCDTSISESCPKIMAALILAGFIPNRLVSPFVTRLLLSLICSYGDFFPAPPSIIMLFDVHEPFSRAMIRPPQFLNSKILMPPVVMSSASNSTPSML